MTKLAYLTQGSGRAFPAYSQVDRYFAASAIEEARQRLVRCVDRGDGLGVAIGAPGIGKTLLLQLLAAQFADRFHVAFLTSTPHCTSKALLQAILFELRQPYRDREEGELRLALIELLLDRQSCPNGVLLLVDEAHHLSTTVLEELRILSNITCSGEPQVRLILAGAMRLDEMFTLPELEVFNQRLTARCYLSPFGLAETVQYVRAQVSAAGANPDELFAAESLEAVHHATDGNPRVIDQVCDRALLIAIDRGLRRVDQSIVEAAWSDLQQLPGPWTAVDTSDTPRQAEVVEFGMLNDEVMPAMFPAAPVVDERTTVPTMRVFQTPEFDASALEERAILRTTAPQRSTADPFAETFQDEEIVLDRFASLEAAFHGNTPRVRNRRETSWSKLLSDVEQHCDAPLPDDEYSDQLPLEFVEENWSQLGDPTAAVADADVLQIEEDLPEPRPTNRHVVRKDYRQLFASLRGD